MALAAQILIAVNDFTDAHMSRISEATADWATITRINQFDEARYAEQIRYPQIVVGWPKADWIADNPVQLLQLGSVGYDAFLGKGLARKSNFTLCNASGVMSVAVAEQLVAMMLALTRRLPQHMRDKLEHRWQRQPNYDEIAGTVACVVGLGDIGTEIAKRLVGLEMKVIGVRQNAGKPHPYASEIYPLQQLKEAVSKSDHIILILPESNETHRMMNAEVFQAMKPGAYFYNMARGGIVDEQALVEALRHNHLSGAGLDVFVQEPLPGHSPLWDLDNVIITPHSGGRSVKEFDRFCQLVVRNLEHYRQGTPFINAVKL